MHHPGFSCPLCRTFADLEADVETEESVPPVSAAPAPEPVAAATSTAMVTNDLPALEEGDHEVLMGTLRLKIDE